MHVEVFTVKLKERQSGICFKLDFKILKRFYKKTEIKLNYMDVGVGGGITDVSREPDKLKLKCPLICERW